MATLLEQCFNFRAAALTLAVAAARANDPVYILQSGGAEPDGLKEPLAGDTPTDAYNLILKQPLPFHILFFHSVHFFSGSRETEKVTSPGGAGIGSFQSTPKITSKIIRVLSSSNTTAPPAFILT